MPTGANRDGSDWHKNVLSDYYVPIRTVLVGKKDEYMIEISTSILNIEKKELVNKVYEIEIAKTDYFHIDVMDGKFVPKDTLEQMMEYAKYIKQVSTIPLDVHFMTEDIKSHIDEYVCLEPEYITFHLEACKDKKEVLELIEYIKEYNCKVGISIKPNTNISEILEYLPYIHLVLVMTVEPGLGGQQLIPDTVEKVRELSEYITKNNLSALIEVDGGIKKENIKDVIEAGAEIFVAGTAITNAENPKEVIEYFKSINRY